jgi:hypothetical protein
MHRGICARRRCCSGIRRSATTERYTAVDDGEIRAAMIAAVATRAFTPPPLERS